jgi:glycosyltransferase involved in cell wall biosynthesis
MSTEKTHTMGLVSIVTPAFNAAAYLSETIASVRAQWYQNWEWLIADDGSTDRTVSIIERAAAADPRIRLVRSQGPSGLAARARNKAMDLARGEYFAFLDADDLWEPEKIEWQLIYMNDHPEVDGVCCWYDVFGDEEQVRNRSRMLNLRTDRICRRAELIEGCPFQTSTVLFHRRCYDLLGGMDEDARLRSMEDSEYFARLISNFEFHRLFETLTHYRQKNGNGSYSARTLSARNERGWNLFEVMQEKKFYTSREARQKRAHLYYEQAKDNLFHVHAPFRRHLVRAVAAGRPPMKALAMLGLSFMPAPMLRHVLLHMGGAVTKRRLKENEHSSE